MYTVFDEFAGVGGSSEGVEAVPGTELIFAANHDRQAVECHAENFPRADHYIGDAARTDITKFPRADIFWASPSCPPWSSARGVRRDFDRTTQGSLFWEETPDPKTRRARALMEEIPRYLQAMIRRGKPVLCGVVENVQECRLWDQWPRWLREVSCDGLYRTRVIALNSMHAKGRSGRAPQSRNRLYVAYWRSDLPAPDWDKWLRPRAYCPVCDKVVSAVQVFKRPNLDMGSYGHNGQYWYRCPSKACKGSIVEPEVTPASAAIDWSIQGQRIADRAEPLAEATMERIVRGIVKFARAPFTTPAGGTWRTEPSPLSQPMPTRTTRENDALVVPPLLVPAEGREGKVASTVEQPMRTQTARAETALATVPPFHINLRGGGSKTAAYPVDRPVGTVTASGTHHGLVSETRLLIPYYSNGSARTADEPIGTITTRDRWSLAQLRQEIDLGDVRFRMLQPAEIGRVMAFPDTYIVRGSKRDKVRMYGNAVTPPAAEIIVSALVEAITGEPLEPAQ
ncbi:DNA cytosine methyltransferase [Streptomyces luteireticuli]|uniref:DNA cytosine methyltransferase n=1 Tax=Streptomyces luteireticuli TaxID=173858 RepID=UPI0035567707